MYRAPIRTPRRPPRFLMSAVADAERVPPAFAACGTGSITVVRTAIPGK